VDNVATANAHKINLRFIGEFLNRIAPAALMQ
jgi:hypothetical protein